MKEPASTPAAISPKTPARALQSTSLTPATAVCPLTVAITATIPVRALVRKNISRRLSLSGKIQRISQAPPAITTKTTAAALQATKGKDTPGKANIK